MSDPFDVIPFEVRRSYDRSGFSCRIPLPGYQGQLEEDRVGFLW